MNRLCHNNVNDHMLCTSLHSILYIVYCVPSTELIISNYTVFSTDLFLYGIRSLRAYSSCTYIYAHLCSVCVCVCVCVCVSVINLSANMRSVGQKSSSHFVSSRHTFLRSASRNKNKDAFSALIILQLSDVFDIQKPFSKPKSYAPLLLRPI